MRERPSKLCLPRLCAIFPSMRVLLVLLAAAAAFIPLAESAASEPVAGGASRSSRFHGLINSMQRRKAAMRRRGRPSEGEHASALAAAGWSLSNRRRNPRWLIRPHSTMEPPTITRPPAPPSNIQKYMPSSFEMDRNLIPFLFRKKYGGGRNRSDGVYLLSQLSTLQVDDVVVSCQKNLSWNVRETFKKG